MKRDFTYLFEIIRNKFIEQQSGKSITMKALAGFLGHEHDGKVTAWKKGQWPSAEDITIIHDKLGFNYRWLLLGEGEPLAKDPTDQENKNFAELKRENDGYFSISGTYQQKSAGKGNAESQLSQNA